MTAKAQLVALLGERDFQDTLINEAQAAHWRVCHFRPAETKKGWRTAVAADGAGYPDLTMTRPPWVLWAELKAEKKYLTPQQKLWQAHLVAIAEVNPYVRYEVWRPHQWDEIVAVIQNPGLVTS